jgi:hypothetical protein
MRRAVCTMVGIMSGVLVACTAREPLGPITAAMTGGKVVAVTPSEATLASGGTQQFAAQFFQNGKEKKSIFTWSSSDPSVATVSSAGTVTAVSAGEVTITATTGTTSGTAHVTVQAAPPQLWAHLSLSGVGAFGSAVSAPGRAWVSQTAVWSPVSFTS